MPECLVPESLTDLEPERAKLLEQFLGLGDFRPGSITASVRRCGKPSCHCAKPNDPGHEPQFRLSRKVRGRPSTRVLPLLPPCARPNGRRRNFSAGNISANN